MKKKALAFVLIVLGAAGLSANSSATAQQPGLPYDPTYRVPVAQQNPEVLPPGIVVNNNNPGVANPGAVGTPAPTVPANPVNYPGVANPGTIGTAAPSVTPNPVNADELLMDNGLWEGASVGPGCAICGGGSSVPPPDWYVEQNARVLTRSRPEAFGIGFVFNTEVANNVGAEVMASDSAAPNISGVWGMTLGHYFARDTQNRDHFVEFTFWGLNNWTDEASYDGGRVAVYNSSSQKTGEHGNLYSGYAVTEVQNSLNVTVPVLNGSLVYGFDRADEETIRYTSSTNNLELNGRFTPRGREDRLVLQPNGKWRQECQPGRYISYLYGVRFFQLNEAFNFHSKGRSDVFDPTTGQLIDSQTYTGDYDIVTHNNLLGLQVGLDITFRECRWAWGFHGKVGPYVNFSDQASDITAGVEYSPSFIRRLAWSKHTSSLIGEAGIQGTYKFRPNLVGRASYDFMWVSGVALAPEQLQFTTNPVNTINDNGFLFMHGATLGLEWLW